MRIAFDSNILLYNAQVLRVEGDRKKSEVVDHLLITLPETITLIVPFQVLGECFHVMMRYGYSREKCRATIMDWINNLETVASNETAFIAAIDLATDHKLQFWDALIINAAADAGCQLLLSEDLQAGFSWRGVTVVNPFAEPMDKRLARLLTDPA